MGIKFWIALYTLYGMNVLFKPYTALMLKLVRYLKVKLIKEGKYDEKFTEMGF